MNILKDHALVVTESNFIDLSWFEVYFRYVEQDLYRYSVNTDNRSRVSSLQENIYCTLDIPMAILLKIQNYLLYTLELIEVTFKIITTLTFRLEDSDHIHYTSNSLPCVL